MQPMPRSVCSPFLTIVTQTLTTITAQQPTVQLVFLGAQQLLTQTIFLRQVAMNGAIAPQLQKLVSSTLFFGM